MRRRGGKPPLEPPPALPSSQSQVTHNHHFPKCHSNISGAQSYHWYQVICSWQGSLFLVQVSCTAWCGLWCLAAVAVVRCKPLANGRQAAESSSVTRRQRPGAPLSNSCFSVAPAEAGYIKPDYGDSLSSSGVAVNIGSEREGGKIARGGNHIKYSFPNTL